MTWLQNQLKQIYFYKKIQNRDLLCEYFSEFSENVRYSPIFGELTAHAVFKDGFLNFLVIDNSPYFMFMN